jgi:hypothetical protein
LDATVGCASTRRPASCRSICAVFQRGHCAAAIAALCRACIFGALPNSTSIGRSMAALSLRASHESRPATPYTTLVRVAVPTTAYGQRSRVADRLERRPDRPAPRPARSVPATRCTTVASATARDRRWAPCQVDHAADTGVVQQFGNRVRQAAGAHVVHAADRIGSAQRHAAVDHFLAAPLHFRVVALHRGEIERLRRSRPRPPTRPRRRRARSASPGRRARSPHRPAQLELLRPARGRSRPGRRPT